MHSKWFRNLNFRIQEWYFEKYGSGFIDIEKSLDVTVLFFGVPYKIKVPLTRIVNDYDGTYTLIFCEDILEDENVFEWIYDSPNLSMFDNNGISILERDIKEVSIEIRKIHNALLLIEYDDVIEKLKSMMLEDIKRAADDLLKFDENQIKHTFWDISIACERALKVLEKNRSGKFTKEHDLLKLYEKINQYVQLDSKDLDNISKYGKSTDLRYGYGHPISRENAFSAYRSGLKVIVLVTSAIKNEYYLDNCKITFKC